MSYTSTIKPKHAVQKQMQKLPSTFLTAQTDIGAKHKKNLKALGTTCRCAKQIYRVKTIATHHSTTPNQQSPKICNETLWNVVKGLASPVSFKGVFGNQP